MANFSRQIGDSHQNFDQLRPGLEADIFSAGFSAPEKPGTGKVLSLPGATTASSFLNPSGFCRGGNLVAKRYHPMTPNERLEMAKPCGLISQDFTLDQGMNWYECPLHQ